MERPNVFPLCGSLVRAGQKKFAKRHRMAGSNLGCADEPLDRIIATFVSFPSINIFVSSIRIGTRPCDLSQPITHAFPSLPAVDSDLWRLPMKSSRCSPFLPRGRGTAVPPASEGPHTRDTPGLESTVGAQSICPSRCTAPRFDSVRIFWQAG